MLRLRVDRVALQDATGQMALLQFMHVGQASGWRCRRTVHCDHLIRARERARPTIMQRAISENDEVYDFLRSAAQKYGIGFWKPGVGHHPPGGARELRLPGRPHDRRRLAHAQRGRPRHAGHRRRRRGLRRGRWPGCRGRCSHPKLIGVHLTGKLVGLGVAQGRDHLPLRAADRQGRHQQDHRVLRPRGGVDQRHRQGHHLQHGRGAGRDDLALPLRRRAWPRTCAPPSAPTSPRLAEQHRQHLVADPEVLRDPPRSSTTRSSRSTSRQLEPHIVGPHSPDRARPISKLAAEVKKERLAGRRSRQALIGSCTNSSYEDMRRAAHIAMQALKAGLKAKTPFLVTPGSERIYQTIKRDGIMDTFQKIGGTVLANACGPCIGQWKRSRRRQGRDRTPSSPRSTGTSPAATTAAPRRCRSSPAPRS